MIGQGLEGLERHQIATRATRTRSALERTRRHWVSLLNVIMNYESVVSSARTTSVAISSSAFVQLSRVSSYNFLVT
eukprot:1116146-Amorphochlora_amoeboformis.AAC.1